MTIDTTQNARYSDYDRYANCCIEECMNPNGLFFGNPLVFTGAPRIHKSHLVLSWLMHMAAGRPFFGTQPNRPYRIVYFQADDGITKASIRERMDRVKIDPAFVPLMRENFCAFASPTKFNGQRMNKVFKTIKGHFGSEAVDIIAIDPVENFLATSENASLKSAITSLLAEAYEAEPEIGLVLVHQSDAMREALHRLSCTYVTMRQPQYGVDKYQLILDDATVKDIELVNDQWREAKQNRYTQQTLNG